MQELLITSFETEWERLVRWSPRLVAAALVLLAAYALGLVVRRGLRGALRRTDLDAIHRSFLERIVFWVVLIIGLSVALATLGLSGAASGLLTGGGLIAVVLAFAFRELGENLLAGLLLALKRPFRVGDLIRSGDFEGTVKNIEVRYTHLRSIDGRDIFVPSSMIFKDPLVNYTLDGMRRFSLVVGIDYRDDAQRATELLVGAAGDVDGVLSDPAVSAWISACRDGWLELELTYWVDAFEESIDIMDVRTVLFHRCCRALLDAGYTVSSEVSTAVTLTQVGQAA